MKAEIERLQSERRIKLECRIDALRNDAPDGDDDDGDDDDDDDDDPKSPCLIPKNPVLQPRARFPIPDPDPSDDPSLLVPMKTITHLTNWISVRQIPSA